MRNIRKTKKRNAMIKSALTILASIVLVAGGAIASYFGFDLWGQATHDKLAFLVIATGCYSSFMGFALFMDWAE